jgi:hypothetical protein
MRMVLEGAELLLRPGANEESSSRRRCVVNLKSIQTAQAARLDGLDDKAVLRVAASQSRIPVSHDKRTMPKALAWFVAAGARARLRSCNYPATDGSLAASQAVMPPASSRRSVMPVSRRMLTAMEER